MNNKEINKEYLSIIENNQEENKKLYKKAIEYINNSTAVYHGEYIIFPYMPKIFSAEIVAKFKDIAHITHGILTKVIKKYLEDENYRKLFPFSEELEELILAETFYAEQLPITRIDFFYDEEDFSFKFCEFNADGTSAMNEDRETFNAVKDTLSFKEFREKHEVHSFELFESWIDEFLKTYDTFKYKVENPTIAIIDFVESSTPNEIIIFKEKFEKRGYKTIIEDIRKLEYKNGALYSSNGEKIDAVYRRVVTSEMMMKIDEIPAFIQAVKDENTCIIGGIRTQVIHNKIIFAILFKEETLSFLTADEQTFIKEHIPYTTWLDEEKDLDKIINNKDGWIIKPDDLFGSSGVYAGIDYDKNEWKRLIEESIGKRYLLQEYANVYKTENYILDENDNFIKTTLGNITGLYVYNGEFKGILSRAGAKGVISAGHGGYTIPSIEVK